MKKREKKEGEKSPSLLTGCKNQKSDIGNFDLTLKLDLEILAGLAIRS